MIKKPITDPSPCTGNILSMNDTLDIIGGKWTLLILHYLMMRPNSMNTFKKMEKDIQGISARMLSSELKKLELNHLVDREILNTKPISVQYNITEYGMTVKPLIDALVQWGHQHRLKIIDNNF